MEVDDLVLAIDIGRLRFRQTRFVVITIRSSHLGRLSGRLHQDPGAGGRR
jgi:hypothetical protein